jgi:hypothetical protein
MKAIKLLLVFFFVTTISCAQESPRQVAEGNINKVNISIDYGAPSVKGRTVWGGLEQYGKVWRAGANENTTISFDKDVKISGKKLTAGKYGFFIIPVENGDWTVIFNKKNDSWGAFSYNQEEDALRVNVKPEFVNDTQEQLKYSIEEKVINFAWEKARLSIPVK